MFRSALLMSMFLMAVPMAGLAASVEPATPIDRPSPTYPEEADDTQGQVKLQFTIDAEGGVRDVQVLESTPPGLFDSAALSAVKTWRYQPRRVDGQPVAQPGNLIGLTFKPSVPDPAQTPVLTRAASIYYPREAYVAGQEGDVTVAFDIDEIGVARNAKVVRTTIPEVFDKSAIDAVETARFVAPSANGATNAANRFSVVVPFRLATAVIQPHRIDHQKLAYPPKQQSRGQPGYCAVTLSLTGDGLVEKAEITDTAPGDDFRATCLGFARSLRFDPPDQDPTGRVARTYSICIRFRFPLTPSLLGEGEWVKIRYTLGTDGAIKDPEIVGVSGPDLDTARVLKNIELHRLKPIVENGIAVEKPGQIIVVSGDGS